MRVFFSLLLLLILATPVLAEPAISCHCFRERDYDPARPGAADPYLLATAQNSLISAAYAADKKAIVKARMTGTSGEDLWIAHYAAARQGRSAAELLTARAAARSWSAVLVPLDPARFGARFAGAVAAGEGDAVLAAIATDETLSARLGVQARELAALRSHGASNQETVLAAFLARRSGRPAVPPFEEVRAGRTSWGTLLHRLGIAPGTVEGEIRRLLR